MNPIAHEIGYVFVDYGHPNRRNQSDLSHAPLRGTRHTDRLICSGNN